MPRRGKEYGLPNCIFQPDYRNGFLVEADTLRTPLERNSRIALNPRRYVETTLVDGDAEVPDVYNIFVESLNALRSLRTLVFATLSL